MLCSNLRGYEDVSAGRGVQQRRSLLAWCFAVMSVCLCIHNWSVWRLLQPGGLTVQFYYSPAVLYQRAISGRRLSDEPGMFGHGQLRLPVEYLRHDLSNVLGRKDLFSRQLYLPLTNDRLWDQRLHQRTRQRQ